MFSVVENIFWRRAQSIHCSNTMALGYDEHRKTRRAASSGLLPVSRTPCHGGRSNHKRVYRIYRPLKLSPRIKPRKRLMRNRPEDQVSLVTAVQTIEEGKPVVMCLNTQPFSGDAVAAFARSHLSGL